MAIAHPYFPLTPESASMLEGSRDIHIKDQSTCLPENRIHKKELEVICPAEERDGYAS
jgi:hypothetical protein